MIPLSGTRLAMIQFNVSKDKNDNLQRMAAQIRKVVKESNPRIVALPECWQMPFHPRYAAEYSEPVPDGPTCQLLSSLAKELNIYIAGGSIAERDGTKCYNTATVFAPSGKMIGKYRKVCNWLEPTNLEFENSAQWPCLVTNSGLYLSDTFVHG